MIINPLETNPKHKKQLQKQTFFQNKMVQKIDSYNGHDIN